MKTNNNGKITFGINRHMHPEFRGVSDEEAHRMMQENSDRIQDGYNKAEAWDLVVEQLTLSPNELNDSILKMLKSALEEVEEENRW